jgi:hypothetical protein
VTFRAALDAIRDAHAGETGALREQLTKARHERDRERERVERLVQEASEARTRAEHAEALAAGERHRADAVQAMPHKPRAED